MFFKKEINRGMGNVCFLPALFFAVMTILISGCSFAEIQHDKLHKAEDPTVFNTDGGWCWYQDERAVIDGGTLLFGGVTSAGDITITGYNLESGESKVVVLHEELQADDHNVPTILVRPDGRYVASYTRHNSDQYMRYRISKEPGSIAEWGPEKRVDVGGRACYSNVYYLKDEDVVYNFHRGRDWDPNYLISDDQGETWEYGGKLMEFSGHRPYVRYASDNRDTIHFVTTEGHPRDYANSIYHGFIKDGAVHRSDGTTVGKLSETSTTPIRPDDLTRVLKGDKDNVGWTSSIVLDENEYPVIGYSVTKDRIRPGSGGFDHRYRYARWNGVEWIDHEIAYAGSRLYEGEDAYTGLISLNPGNPNMVYISSDVHPETGEPLISQATGKRQYEIFQGITDDNGNSWNWEQVTENSEVDNIRPVIVSQNGKRVLLWLRGEYRTFTDYNLEVVGFVTES